MADRPCTHDLTLVGGGVYNYQIFFSNSVSLLCGVVGGNQTSPSLQSQTEFCCTCSHVSSSRGKINCTKLNVVTLCLFFFFPSSTCTECNMFTQARRQKMLRAKFSLTQGQIVVSQSLNQQLDTKSFHNHILGTITNCFISNLLEALTLFLKWEGVYVVFLGNPLIS